MSELPGFHPSPRARQSLANQTWQVGGKESALAILKRATRALQPAAHWEGAPRPARAGRAWEAEKGQDWFSMRTGVLGVVREEKDGGRGNVLSVVFPGAWSSVTT